MEEYITVRIFILTNTNNPGRVNIGIAMWLIEFLKAGKIPVTRQGFVHGEQITQTELALKALINAFTKLKKPCSALIYCDNTTVVNTVENGWFVHWEKENWTKLNGKPVKYPELWEMLREKLEPHIYSIRSGRHDYSNIMEHDLKEEFEGWKREKEHK
jgi:ribonuclease HI